MAFALGGSGNVAIIITTDAETDESLFASALNAPSGNVGTYVSRIGDADIWAYYSNDKRYVVTSGSWTIADCILNFGESTVAGPTISNSSTLTIGASFAAGASTIYEDRAIVKFPDNGTNIASATLACINGLSGSTTNLYGAEIRSKSSFIFDSGSTVNIINSVITLETPSGGANTAQIRFSNTAFNINGLLLSGGPLVFLANPNSIVGLKAYNCPGTTGAIAVSTVAPAGDYRLTGFDGEGNSYDLNLASNPSPTRPNILTIASPIKNSADISVTYSSTNTTNTNARGIYLFTRKLSYTIRRNSNSAAIENAKVYLKDSNSGNRISASSVGFGNYSADITYSGTSNSSGVIPDIEFNEGIRSKPVGSSSMPAYDSRVPLLGGVTAYEFFDIPLSVTGDERRTFSLIANSFVDAATYPFATAAAITGVAFSSGTITVSAGKTWAEFAHKLEYEVTQTDNVYRWTTARYWEFSTATAGVVRANLVFSGSSADVDASGVIEISGTRTIDITAAQTLTARVQVNAASIVTVANGTTDLTAWTFASGADINLRSGATAATVQVAASQIANITAGAGVTLAAPPTTVEVDVDGPADYYVAVIQSGARLNTSDTGIQTGTYSFSTAATGSALVRVRRQGWTDFQTTITLGGGTVEVGARLTQEVDANATPLYTGLASTLIDIVVDAADAAHKIQWTGNGDATAQLIYDEVQSAKVGAAGMLTQNLQATLTRYDPFLQAISLPSQVQFENTNSANLNCAFIGFASQAAGALVDGTSGNGNIRVVSSLGLTAQQNRDSLLLAPTVGATVEDGSIDDQLADIASTGGSLTTEQDEKLTALYGTLESSGETTEVFTAEALANVSGGGGGGLDAAGVRGALGMAAANLDTQLGNIYADTLRLKYQDAIWINTVSGASGTVVGTNGTPANPCNSLANAETLVAATGINNLKVYPGSSITINAAKSNLRLSSTSRSSRSDYTVTISSGGSLSNCIIENSRVVASAALTFSRVLLSDCAVQLNAVIEATDSTFDKCPISGTSPVRVAAFSTLRFKECIFYFTNISRATPTLAAGGIVLVDNCTGVLDIDEMTAGTYEVQLLQGSGVLTESVSITPTVYDLGGFWTVPTSGINYTRFSPENLDPAVLDEIAEGTGTTLPSILADLLTSDDYTASLPDNFSELAIDGDGLVTTTNPGGGATAAEVWANAERTLTGTQATALDAIPAILEDTSTIIPGLIDALPDPLDATATKAAAAEALTEYDPPTKAELDSAVGAVTVAGYATGQSPATLVDLTGLSTLDGDDIATALTTYDVAKVEDVEVTVTPEITVQGGFTVEAAADLAAAKDAAEAAQSAAEAVADGRHVIDYTASTTTQYNADGSERTVFELLDADGNPATSGQTAVERAPQ